MSVKYHISPVTGKPERCTATKRPCKYGADTKHYESKAAANEAAEKLNEEKAASAKLVKKSAGASPVRSKRSSRTGFRLSALDDASRTLLKRSKEEGAKSKSIPTEHDVWEYNSTALRMAGSTVRNIKKSYDASKHSYEDRVKALSELMFSRAESSTLISKSDKTVKNEIFNAIDSALPERLQGRLATRVNRYVNKGGKLTDDYKNARSRVFASTRKTLSALDKKLADHKDDSRYSYIMGGLSKYARGITSMSCEGKSDDDAVLTVRMCELRNECLTEYLERGRNPAYEDAVNIINSNLPDYLEKRINYAYVPGLRD